MKALFLICLLLSSAAFADTTAHEDAIQRLVVTLETRDATIRELRDDNLDLLVKNLELKRRNTVLKKQLQAKVETKNVYKQAIARIKTITNSFK